MSIQVTNDQIGLRVDKVLANHPLIKTRSRAERLISDGRVHLAGSPIKASYRCRAGDVFEIFWPLPAASSLTPWEFPLEIVFEDEHLLVVNKPAGLVVHPSLGHHDQTLVNALLAHTKELSMGFHELRPGIVHRLDKDTSGLLVVAKNAAAQRGLALQFKEKFVHRIYWAFVLGTLKNRSGTIQTRLSRHPYDRKRFASVKDPSRRGKQAITHYRVLQSHRSLSWLECRLGTGRTHQIRVHLSELGHPLIGDPIYGSASKIKNIVIQNPRLGLLAKQLGFEHPISKAKLLFDIGVPQELRAIMELYGFTS